MCITVNSTGARTYKELIAWGHLTAIIDLYDNTICSEELHPLKEAVLCHLVLMEMYHGRNIFRWHFLMQ